MPSLIATMLKLEIVVLFYQDKLQTIIIIIKRTIIKTYINIHTNYTKCYILFFLVNIIYIDTERNRYKFLYNKV